MSSELIDLTVDSVSNTSFDSDDFSATPLTVVPNYHGDLIQASSTDEEVLNVKPGNVAVINETALDNPVELFILEFATTNNQNDSVVNCVDDDSYSVSQTLLSDCADVCCSNAEDDDEICDSEIFNKKKYSESSTQIHKKKGDKRVRREYNTQKRSFSKNRILRNTFSSVRELRNKNKPQDSSSSTHILSLDSSQLKSKSNKISRSHSKVNNTAEKISKTGSLQGKSPLKIQSPAIKSPHCPKRNCNANPSANKTSLHQRKLLLEDNAVIRGPSRPRKRPLETSDNLSAKKPRLKDKNNDSESSKIKKSASSALEKKTRQFSSSKQKVRIVHGNRGEQIKEGISSKSEERKIKSFKTRLEITIPNNDNGEGRNPRLMPRKSQSRMKMTGLKKKLSDTDIKKKLSNSRSQSKSVMKKVKDKTVKDFNVVKRTKRGKLDLRCQVNKENRQSRTLNRNEAASTKYLYRLNENTDLLQNEKYKLNGMKSKLKISKFVSQRLENRYKERKILKHYHERKKVKEAPNINLPTDSADEVDDSLRFYPDPKAGYPTLEVDRDSENEDFGNGISNSQSSTDTADEDQESLKEAGDRKPSQIDNFFVSDFHPLLNFIKHSVGHSSSSEDTADVKLDNDKRNKITLSSVHSLEMNRTVEEDDPENFDSSHSKAHRLPIFPPNPSKEPVSVFYYIRKSITSCDSSHPCCKNSAVRTVSQSTQCDLNEPYDSYYPLFSGKRRRVSKAKELFSSSSPTAMESNVKIHMPVSLSSSADNCSSKERWSSEVIQNKNSVRVQQNLDFPGTFTYTVKRKTPKKFTVTKNPHCASSTSISPKSDTKHMKKSPVVINIKQLTSNPSSGNNNVNVITYQTVADSSTNCSSVVDSVSNSQKISSLVPIFIPDVPFPVPIKILKNTGPVSDSSLFKKITAKSPTPIPKPTKNMNTNTTNPLYETTTHPTLILNPTNSMATYPTRSLLKPITSPTPFPMPKDNIATDLTSPLLNMNTTICSIAISKPADNNATDPINPVLQPTTTPTPNHMPADNMATDPISPVLQPTMTPTPNHMPADNMATDPISPVLQPTMTPTPNHMPTDNNATDPISPVLQSITTPTPNHMPTDNMATDPISPVLQPTMTPTPNHMPTDNNATDPTSHSGLITCLSKAC